ncbi:MAG: NIL domain-containing protein [Turneriella sp.]|nr:NIL domain-containing protein [Turneriella sp.]
MVKKLRLEVPAKCVGEPFIYRMVTEYNLKPNILEANLAPDRRGSLVIELRGKPQDIERGILFLREADIEVTIEE